MILTGKTAVLGNPLSSATSFTTNPTCTCLASNLGLRSELLAISYLNYGPTFSPSNYQHHFTRIFSEFKY
jgi:hypothetical protein